MRVATIIITFFVVCGLTSHQSWFLAASNTISDIFSMTHDVYSMICPPIFRNGFNLSIVPAIFFDEYT